MAARRAKRSIDIVAGTLLLVASAPLLIPAVLAVLLEDGLPVLHPRLVVGQWGREFHALKLRSMRKDADVWLNSNPELRRKYERETKLVDDPRITGVGRVLRRLSIDELPQLWNVIRGDMSLVGPRMIHPSEAQFFGKFLEERQAVKPGLTGWWQVRARDRRGYEARIALDKEYLARQSLRFDLWILVLTIPAVLRRRGAH